VNPAAGLKRIFSITGVGRLGFGLFKLIVIAGVAGLVIWSRRDDVIRASGLDVAQLGAFLADVALKVVLWTALALVILALFDYGLQWWKQEQDLKMTHQEVREEMKDMQGDPQIAARRRQIQRQMAMSRASNEVPKADVIVTNPTELAVAIQYDPLEMAAPVVVAKGAGVVAQRIRRLGLEHNIPIVERKPLAQLLYKNVDIGKPVPTDSYAAVAEVLAYVYQLKGKKMPTPPRAA
jgi:flagellar biosynthetic protein FlhB